MLLSLTSTALKTARYFDSWIKSYGRFRKTGSRGKPSLEGTVRPVEVQFDRSSGFQWLNSSPLKCPKPSQHNPTQFIQPGHEETAKTGRKRPRQEAQP